MKRSLVLFAALAIGLSAGSAQQKTLKAGFIYIGPVGDYGWTAAHDEGRLLAERALPWLETLKVESVPEGQAMPYIDQLVKNGAEVVFTTSFGYMDETLQAAKKYPNVIFAHASGFKRAPNMATYMADFYQLYYLNGLMAGALSKTNKVGYIGAFPVPEVKRHINAFALGVRAVNPKATVSVRWINAWYSPTAAKAATEALISDGVDTFAFTEDSPTVVQVAGQKKLASFGHYSPMQKFAPQSVISGQLVHWEKIYIDFLTKVHNGTYTTKNLANVDYWWLLGERAVELGSVAGIPINPLFVPQLKKVKLPAITGATDAYDLVLKRLAAMSSRKPTFDPFTGPIRDRNGILRVTNGKTLSVADLTSIEWAAPGVLGPWPNEPK